MIIKSNLANIKVIPKLDGVGAVRLLPGYNEVDDNEWKTARNLVIDYIENGMLVEEWTKIAAEQKDSFPLVKQEEKQWYTSAQLKDINRPRVKDVVKDCYDIDVLKRWLDNELRADVRLEILKQLANLDRNNSEDYLANYHSELSKS